MRHAWFRSSVIVLILTSVCASPSPAYAPREHRSLSNSALELCLAVLREDPTSLLAPGIDPVRKSEAIEALERLLAGPGGRPTYGDLVASVDHYRDPNDFLRRKEAQLGSSPPRKRSILRIGLDRLAAVHGNTGHFQDHALRLLETFHREAVLMASAGHSGEDLEKALVRNALSDHFLQDFLAPGHVATPRSRFHDLSSASLHDTYNRQGLLFLVNASPDGAFGRLVELAHAAKAVSFSTGQPVQAGEACRSESLSLSWEDSEELTAYVEHVQENGSTPVTLYGDGMLSSTPPQDTLLMLLVARSVLDVVSSFLEARVIDLLESGNHSWTPASALKRKDSRWWQVKYDADSIEPAQGGIAIGRYDLRLPSQLGGQSYASPPLPGLNTDIFRIQGLMLSYDVQKPFEEGSSTRRRVVRLDYLPNAVAPPGSLKERREEDQTVTDDDLIEASSMTLMGGFYLDGDGYHASGLHLGGLALVDEWNAQIRFWAGYGEYTKKGQDTYKAIGGIGLEKGFGLLFLHLNLERDYTYDRPGHLAADWMTSLGLNFMFPTSWFKHLRPQALRSRFGRRKSCGG